MKIDDIRLTKEEVSNITKRVNVPPADIDIASTATDKANRWWIKWVERALLVHPDNRKTWKKQYLEALKNLVEGG